MRFAIVEKPVAELSGRYARVLAKNPFIFIIIPLIITSFLSVGIIFKLKIVRGVHFLYSPEDAKWMFEEEIFKQIWATDDNRFYPGKDVILRKGLYLIVSSKDGGNVLEPKLCTQLINLLDSISNSKFMTSNGSFVNFSDICLRFQNQCFSNTHVRMLAEVFERNQTEQMNVTYPLFSSKFLSEPLDLSSTIGGVELDSTKSFILSAKAWLLVYQLRQQTVELNQLSSEFQYKIPELIEQIRLPNLKVDHFHSEAFDDELAKNTRDMAPRFAITFTILIVFSILCTFTTTKSGNQMVIDWVISKPVLGITGVISTLMAIISATGLLLLMNVTFVDICSVMPFLSLSIGTDDSFLLLSAWRETNPRDRVEDRIEKTLRHSGVAILITSLADSLAFLVGASSSMPAVKYFSLYCSAAICFIYLYTMTLFAAIMVLQGRLEENGCNSVLGCKTETIENKEIKLLSKLFNTGSRQSFIDNENSLWYQDFFANTYLNFISFPLVQVLAALSYIFYLFITLNGLQQLRVGFDLMIIVTKGSSTENFINMRSKYFIDDLSQLDVAILKPPNMGNITQRGGFLEILERFEHTNCSSGRSHTKFWFFAYQSYLDEMGFGGISNDMDLNYTEFREQLQPFLINSAKYSYDIIENEKNKMSQFRLSIGLNRLQNDEQILECAKQMRKISENSRQTFDIQTHSALWNLADQFEVVWPQTLQDIFISVFIMLIVALLFIPKIICSITICLSIVSVSFGVLGFLHFMGAKLNATSMITLAMSVGFSVDFASHLTYAFMSIESKDPKMKLSGALKSVGFPITQTSFAVLLGVITLGTVQNQLVQTVFKAVLLVILFGLLHALVYIPLMLLNILKFQLFIKNCFK